MNPSRECSWGILGAANIARKNWQAMRWAGNAQLVAVASREMRRAERFIAECQGSVPWPEAPRALGSYEALIASPDIDALYVPLPTAARKPWAIRVAEAGKHLLTEKPVAATAADAAEIIAACRANGVQFMDGVMFMHSARLGEMRRRLNNGRSVGRIRRIASQFSFLGSDEFRAGDIRVNPALEPLGCLGDLGWYNIRLALWSLNYQLPQRVWGRMITESHAAGQGVPLEFSAEMQFADGVSASFYCSFVTELQQWASISGDRGNLYVRDFVAPFFGSDVSFDVLNTAAVRNGCHFNMEPRAHTVVVPEYSSGAATAQETNMFRRFSELVLEGRLDDSWGDIALATQRVVDACLASARSGQPVDL